MQFSFMESWLNNEKSFPISVSIPLTSDHIDNETANNFFVNLLPEERIRKRTCEKLGISEGNHYELLRRIGGDCAGALTILEEGSQPISSQDGYEPITEKQLADWSKGDHYAFAVVAGVCSRTEIRRNRNRKRVYPQLSKKLAMSISGEFLPGAVTPEHLTTFAEELGVKPSYVNELANETVDRMQSSLEETIEGFRDMYGDSPIATDS